MKNRILQYADGFSKEHQRQRNWRKVVSVLAAVVVFCTTYALILPAITMEKTAYCGIEAHEHSDACYERRLTCTIPEGDHVHTDACYTQQLVLICGQEESETHTHTEECYGTEQVLTCGQEETAHTHTDACYEKVLTCQKKEHTHTEACYADKNADLESQADWEKTLADVELTGHWPEDVIAIAETQLGYTESSRNYTMDKDGATKLGYTRYGAWYGVPYGDWCAMFVSFCLNYAEVEDFPFEASCPAWIEELQKESYDAYRSAGSDYEPKSGDLVFFDWDGDGSADHIGLAAEIKALSSSKEAKELTTIEGNSADKVQKVTYDLDDERILGYGQLPEHSSRKKLTYEGADYTIRVSFTSEAQIPEDAALSVRELTGEEYEERCEKTKEKMGVDELSFARFFDISFVADGKEIEPAAPVDVEITYADCVEIGQDQIKGAVHFASGGTELLDAETRQNKSGDTVFSFTQGSFSVVGTAVGITPYTETTGTVTGTQTDELKEDAWYILYSIRSDSIGFALDASNPSNPLQLSQASTSRGSVEYDGNGDVLWQYTKNGFKNKNGQYLTLTYANDWYRANVGLSTDPARAAVTYSATYDVLYNTESVTEPNGAAAFRYNMIYSNSNLWNGDVFAGVSELTLKSQSIPFYIAYVGEGGSSSGGSDPAPVNTSHPLGSVTGTPQKGELILYNIDASADETGSNEPRTLAGVSYTIYRDKNGKKGSVVKSLTTIDSFALSIGTLAPGKYIAEQTGVPKEGGYIVSPQTRSFTVDTDGNATIGVFYDYKAGEGDSIADKTAQVIDYVNRTYQIDLSAASGKYGYELDSLNFSLAVDQSNSMLFPAQLTDTGKRVMLYQEPDEERYWDWGWHEGEKDRNNKALNAEALGLDKKQVYYLLSDEKTTSTVWAIWYDDSDPNKEGWCYQDASYYAKAQFKQDLGIEQNAKDGDSYVSFAQPGDAYSQGNRNGYPATNGGGFDKTLGSHLGRDAGAGTPFTIYTGSQYNRLHELQEGVSILANLLGSLNPQTTMQLVTFCKTVGEAQNVALDNNGIQKVIEAVDKITTSGGTRQDLALNHIADHDLKKGKQNYVILITDGAPSGTSTTTVETAATALKNKGNVTLVTVGLSMENVDGGSTMLENIASDKDSDIDGKWCYAANKTGELADVLMNEIFGSIAKLHLEAATSVIQDTISDSFYLINPADNTPLAAGTWIDLNGNVLPDPTAEQKKNAGQVVYDSDKKEWSVRWSDQVLPVGADRQVQLNEGDFIGQNSSGYYKLPNSNGAIGKIVKCYDGVLRVDKQGYSQCTIYDRFIDLSAVQTTEKGSAWHASLYVKAKEDFIGGNAIDTNKSATITLKEGESLAAQSFELETPTVNVHLLPMESFDGEATLFLGDTVNRDTDNNGVPDVMEDLTSHIDFKKLIPSAAGDTPYNKADATEADGCEENTFTVAYATNETGGGLTAAEWAKLKQGESVTFPYTYDDDSSHGPVGYFTLKLVVDEKSVCKDCGQHFCDHVGKDVLSYSLKLTYTAYQLGESTANASRSEISRPASNVHNIGNGPGTEVGSAGTTELNNGKGDVEAAAGYSVNVVDGKITVTKELEQAAAEDMTFAFELLYQETNGDTVTQTPYAYGTIKIPEGQKTGTETHVHLYDADGKASEDTTMATNDGNLVFQHLKRGSYVVQESQAENSVYAVKSAAVVEDKSATNCPAYLNQEKTSATFHIGYHPVQDGEADNIVIFDTAVTEDGHHIIYSSEWQHVQSDNPVTEYHGESYGTVKFVNTKKTKEAEIPVQKSWSDHEAHGDDTVYAALYDGDTPVVDEEDRVEVLRLNASNGWKGSFKINIPVDKELTDYNYSIRELSGVTDDSIFGNTGKTAVVVNDNNKAVCYESAAADGDFVKIGEKTYVANYGGDVAASLTVTNTSTYALPQTGGTGTTDLYFLGGILMMTAVGYGYRLRRRRERRAER